jgi:hypothetical protein
MARELSRDPHAVRRRLRRNEPRTSRDIAILAEVQYKPVAEWDLDELARGRPRNEDGKFPGGKPKWITRAVDTEIRNRLSVEALARLGACVGEAIDVIRDIIRSPDVDPRLKADAARFVIEHIIGKPKQRVDIAPEDGFKSILANALVMRDLDGNVIDAHPVIDVTDDD